MIRGNDLEKFFTLGANMNAQQQFKFIIKQTIINIVFFLY